MNESFYNMRCVVMFEAAVCLIFLLKLKWPKNKSVYEIKTTSKKLLRHNALKLLPVESILVGIQEKGTK